MVVLVSLGEEVGWRGYALPALQARYGALVSSVVLGTMWALWHLPLFFNPDMFYSNMPFVIQLAIQVPMAILFTWVFNSTGGSVLLAILLHSMINASGQLWKVMPEYAVEPASAAKAAAATTHMNLMFAIVIGIAAAVGGARLRAAQPLAPPQAGAGSRRWRVPAEGAITQQLRIAVCGVPRARLRRLKRP
jgi:membrane protease YdiL (CAAX protease family)